MAGKNCKLLLPLSRIKNIIRSSPGVSNISPDLVFLIGKAAEGLIAFLLKQTIKNNDNKRLIDYSDIAKIVSEMESLKFLRPAFPITVNEDEKCEFLFPLSRIKMIMRSSPAVKNINPDSVFVIAKAAEGFIAFLLRQALKASDNKKVIDYSSLAKVVSENDTLEFLRDVFPPQIKGYKYLEILQKVEEQEMKTALEDSEYI